MQGIPGHEFPADISYNPLEFDNHPDQIGKEVYSPFFLDFGVKPLKKLLI
jgi:hypothetical protein